MYCMFIFVDDIYRFRLNITVSDHRCIHSFQCKMKPNLAFLTHYTVKAKTTDMHCIRLEYLIILEVYYTHFTRRHHYEKKV